MSLAPVVFDEPFNTPSSFVVETRILEYLFAFVTSELNACEQTESLRVVQGLSTMMSEMNWTP